MTDLPSSLNVHVLASLEAHYAATISALSRRNLCATFGFLLLSPGPFLYRSISKQIFPFLFIPPLSFELSLPSSFPAASLRIFQKL